MMALSRALPTLFFWHEKIPLIDGKSFDLERFATKRTPPNCGLV